MDFPDPIGFDIFTVCRIHVRVRTTPGFEPGAHVEFALLLPYTRGRGNRTRDDFCFVAFAQLHLNLPRPGLEPATWAGWIGPEFEPEFWFHLIWDLIFA